MRCSAFYLSRPDRHLLAHQHARSLSGIVPRSAKAAHRAMSGSRLPHGALPIRARQRKAKRNCLRLPSRTAGDEGRRPQKWLESVARRRRTMPTSRFSAEQIVGFLKEHPKTSDARREEAGRRLGDAQKGARR